MTGTAPRPTPPDIDEPSPDVLEQRQRPDGTIVESSAPPIEPTDHALTPDEIEQRQDLVDPDDFDDDERPD